MPVVIQIGILFVAVVFGGVVGASLSKSPDKKIATGVIGAVAGFVLALWALGMPPF